MDEKNIWEKNKDYQIIDPDNDEWWFEIKNNFEFFDRIFEAQTEKSLNLITCKYVNYYRVKEWEKVLYSMLRMLREELFKKL